LILILTVGESAGESAAFTIGDRNVYAGTRQKLANNPYPDPPTLLQPFFISLNTIFISLKMHFDFDFDF
jgi:hypothetical protein